MSMNSDTKDRVRLLIVATGVAIVAIPTVVAAVVLIPGLNHINWKWARFTVVTVFLIVFCVKTYWRARAHLRFWGILLAVLVLHFVGIGFFFYRGSGLPLILFGPAVGLEFGLLALAVYRFLGIGPPGPKRRSESPADEPL
jgi:hypothetical protein